MLPENRRTPCGQLSAFYRKALEDVIAFWTPRTRDAECGGYLTCFDRRGNLTDTDKYVWFQGRQLWMFSALYRRLEPRPEWLDLAEWGRDFLVRHAYAGGGRWFYHLDRAGRLKNGTISIYTDHFMLSGLCEFAAATGRTDDLGLIRETYDAIERNIHDPDFKDLFHGTWSPKYQRHGLYMISLHVAGLAGLVLGEERTRPLMDHCLDKILHVFAKDDRRLLFESVGRDGAVIDEPEGRVINPGHALESMWFCMEEGLRRGDRGIVQRAAEIVDWSWDVGSDREYGGIFAYLDAAGGEPLQTAWHRETGARWDDKIWWVHSEALYALALSALTTGNDRQFGRFLALHDWCWKHFHDPECGEWYAELWRDGRPKNTDKGTLWKAAYHLPRALLFLHLLFARAAGMEA